MVVVSVLDDTGSAQPDAHHSVVVSRDTAAASTTAPSAGCRYKQRFRPNLSDGRIKRYSSSVPDLDSPQPPPSACKAAPSHSMTKPILDAEIESAPDVSMVEKELASTSQSPPPVPSPNVTGSASVMSVLSDTGSLQPDAHPSEVVPGDPAIAPTTAPASNSRYKQRFRPNLSDSRIRRYSGSVPDLGSPNPLPPACKAAPPHSITKPIIHAETESVPDVSTVERELPTAFRSPPPAPLSTAVGSKSTSSLVSKENQQPAQVTAPSARFRRSTDSRCSVDSSDKDASVLEARKAEHKRRFTTGIPERTKITMFDLIYYNPSQGNRMPSSRDSSVECTDDAAAEAAAAAVPVDNAELVQRLEEERLDEGRCSGDEQREVEQEDDDTDGMPVPRVKVGPDGSIILDESSTLIETTAAKKAKEDLMRSTLVFETGNKATNYGSWVKRKKAVDWSEKETVRFFKALSVFGTDFSMMEKIFKRRSRQELKMKFKKEERLNRSLVDKCLTQGLGFDASVFDSDDSCDLEPSLPPAAGTKKRKLATVHKVGRKKGPTKKPKRPRKVLHKRGYFESSDEAEADTPEAATLLPTMSVESDALPGNGQLRITPPGPAVVAEDVHPKGASLSKPPSDAISLETATSPCLLKSILTSPKGTKVSLPPALLAANPSLAGAGPGSLVVVAAGAASSSTATHGSRARPAVGSSGAPQVFVLDEHPNDGRPEPE